MNNNQLNQSFVRRKPPFIAAAMVCDITTPFWQILIKSRSRRFESLLSDSRLTFPPKKKRALLDVIEPGYARCAQRQILDCWATALTADRYDLCSEAQGNRGRIDRCC